MENGMITRGYKSSPFGPIPEDWDIKTVGTSFNICNNLRFPINETERQKIQGTYPYYGPTKIQDFINEYRVNGKYALIGEDGDHFLKWRELPMTLLIKGKFNVNNHAHLIQGDENLTEWFFYFFNHRELTPHLTRQGAGRYKLTKDALSKMPIVIPPLKEQTAIANLLNTWDKAINTLTQIIAQKEQRKKWLMQQLLTGKKRLKGFKGEWRGEKLGDLLLRLSNGLTYDTTLTSGAPVTRIETISSGIINYDKVGFAEPAGSIGNYLMKEGDILYSHINSLSHIGKVAYYDGKCMLYHGMNLLLLRPNHGVVSKKFLFHWFNSNSAKRFAIKIAKPAVQQASISTSDLSVLEIEIPSKEEQEAIVGVLQSSLDELAILNNKLDRVIDQKKGLMQILLTGKKRLKTK